MRQLARITAALTLLVFPTIASAQDVVLQASSARVAGKWVIAPDGSAPGGQVVKHPDASGAKVTSPVASPANYFEVTFTATAGRPYRLWLLGRAEDAYWGNDSVWVQFSDSVTASGSPTFRIGTTSGAEVNLEECAGCGVPTGFAWQDNGYGRGALGPLVYFGKTGTQTLRVQTREDGLAVNQILLSPSAYLNLAPPVDTGGGSSGSDVILRADGARVAGRWVVASDSSAPSAKVVRHPNANGAKVETPLASPSNYFEMTFSATAGKPYRLWILGRAQDDSWSNDSVWVQFSHSTTSSGSATYRIGTSSGASVNLEDCSGCGLEPRFAWQDNGYGRGVLGPLVYFSQTGTQTLRVQTREDGLAIDQILLSPASYLNAAPPPPSGPTPPPSPAPPPPDDPPPPPPSPTATELKMLSWNTHHGTDTAGVCSVDRIADWIVRTGANVVALNEVEKASGWCSGMDQPAQYLSLLRGKTGRTWYASFAQRDGNTHGQGNLVLSQFPLEAAEDYQLTGSRSVARAQMLVNGIRVNVYSTHLDNESASLRMTELLELKNWADNYPEQRIIAGDFNAWDGAPEILNLLQQYFDAWRVARSAGTSVGYTGNTGGATKGGARIDYVFYSRGASRLTLKQARVFDIVQSNGVSPSDHRPVLATFEVR